MAGNKHVMKNNTKKPLLSSESRFITVCNVAHTSEVRFSLTKKSASQHATEN